MENETLMGEDEGSLRWPDWIVVGIMLAASTAIGIYYRFTGGKQKTAEEYFSADRSTGVGLLSIAMMVAFLSGISLLGCSGENYSYGAQFNLVYVGLILGTPIVAYFFLPVFYELKTMSVFEYLERRFGVTARLVASFANFLQFSLFTGVVIYAPSLALEATTGLDGTMSTLLVGFICTFYSTIGGMKAVIITDVLQGILMFTCVYCIIGVAVMELNGGIWSVLDIAEEGGRINIFKLEFDPTIRHTWLSLTIGGTFFFLTQYAVNQVQVQRMLTAKTIGDARKALFLNVPLTLSLTSVVSFSGLTLYAYYRNCDPVSAGKIKSYEMIMPYFAKDRLSKIPGLTGVFVSGVFSASLSTVSAMLNSLAAIALADYLMPICKKFGHEVPNEKTAFYGKFLVLLIGCCSLGVAFLASKMGSLVQTVAKIHGAIGGPILGLFTLGMFFESANETGAVIGTILALASNMWMAFTPKPTTPFLPMSVEGCLNSTIIFPPTIPSDVIDADYSYFDRLSYMWYTPMGWNGALSLGHMLSTIINKFSKTPPPVLEPNLFTPIIAARIRRRREKEAEIGSQVFVLDPKTFESHNES